MVIFEALANHSGISNKIKAQVAGFRNNGIDMKLSSLELDTNRKKNYYGRTVDGKLIEKFSKIKILNKLQRLYRFEKLIDYIQKREIKLVYIRYVHTANPFFINFLKRLKDMEVHVLLEVPTYPYDQEYLNATVKQKMLLKIEKSYRKQFRNFVDNIITFSNDTTIFDVPTIQINNGVDIGKINFTESHHSDYVGLIGVASLSFWHGFDRVIEGLSNYYSNGQAIEIYFNIVGDKFSSEAIKYRTLVDELNLEKYVIFHDKQFGEELDRVFNVSHIGVGCLGVHRKNITHAKSLKNREYCARGIPFIYSETDNDFDDKPFVLKFPADDSPVNIDEIINFLRKKEFDAWEIRSYAEKNLSWDGQIHNILRVAKIKPAMTNPL